MKRNQFVWIGLVLALLLSACGGSGPNTVKLKYMPDDNKVVLNPDQGTVIRWDGATWQGAKGVDFPFGNPCNTSNDAAGQCTISVPKGRVPYSCDNCVDPEIVVGTYPFLGKGRTPDGQPITKAPTAEVFMACTNNQISIYPTEVTISKATVAAGATVLWVPGNLSPVGQDWKVVGFSTTICSAAPYGQNNSTCTLDPNAMPGPTTYTVSAADSCPNSTTTGKITITQ
jgi:hypothetical protein